MHPFYVPQKGWIEAVKLRAGDILVTCNGEYVVVEKVQHEILESPVIVYNFEVEDFHTYYIAANDDAEFVLVHNSCRGKNDLLPNPDAEGPHSTFKYDNDGRISHYATYEPNPRNPSRFDEVLRFDGVGKAHAGIETPHFHILRKTVVRGLLMRNYYPRGYIE